MQTSFWKGIIQTETIILSNIPDSSPVAGGGNTYLLSDGNISICERFWYANRLLKTKYHVCVENA